MNAPVAPVDLRSDTVTKPSPEMRAVMARAAVGDDVIDVDPTVQELEELAAHLTGMEAALFVPSGCMANLIAQMVHVRRGDEVLVGQDAHIVLHEVGSGAALAGVQYEVVPGDGRITAAEVAARIKAPTFHTPGTGLVWVENPHTGRTTAAEEMRRIAAVCRERGVPLHLDGARVFNASVALGLPVRELTAPADSVSFCLSKGLGAPVGSMVCGTRAFRTAAHRFRKMLGGGMRQAGILAAAGLYALAKNVDRLADDHRRARRLAERLEGAPGLAVRPADVETNMVIAELAHENPDAFADRCAARGVQFFSHGPRHVRLVTHLDLDDAALERGAQVIRESLGAD